MTGAEGGGRSSLSGPPPDSVGLDERVSRHGRRHREPPTELVVHSRGIGPGGFVGSGRAAFLFCAVIMVTHGFGNGLAPALLPRIGDSFGSGYGALGLAVSSGLLAYGVGAAIGVRVVAVFPLRGIILTSLGVSLVGFLVAVSVRSPEALAVAVVMVGLLAPISWSASVRLIARVVNPSAHGRVMAVAGAGAGVGGGINGVFVLFLAGPDEWRLAFAIAAGASVATAVAMLALLPGVPVSDSDLGGMAARNPPAPHRSPLKRLVNRGRDAANALLTSPPGTTSLRKGWQDIWAARTGRMVILLSISAGVGGFTFVSYMSATGVGEMGASPVEAGLLWWVASSVGLVAAVAMGTWSDRVSPVPVVGVIALVYATSLCILLLHWSYGGLLIAAAGFGVFNYPIWGLLGHLAGQGMGSRLGVRAVSGGLTAAALSAVVSIALAGWWIDRTGSFRSPVIVLAAMGGVVATLLAIEYLRGRAGPVPGGQLRTSRSER